MPLGQSAFLLHAVPVPFAGAFSQEPLRHVSDPVHMAPAQHASPAAPHGPLSPAPVSPPTALPSTLASCGMELSKPPPPASTEPPPTHAAPSQANPASVPPLPPLLLEQLAISAMAITRRQRHDVRPIIECLRVF
jgi:hypothetical protein